MTVPPALKALSAALSRLFVMYKLHCPLIFTLKNNYDDFTN